MDILVRDFFTCFINSKDYFSSFYEEKTLVLDKTPYQNKEKP